MLGHVDQRGHGGGVVERRSEPHAGHHVRRGESATPSGAATPNRSASGPASDLEADYRRVIQSVLPSVVEIRTQQALGSGVVLDGNGDIVTNAHVVGSASQFEVFLPGRADPVKASLRGTYLPDDLAVIRLADSSGARPATFGHSADLQVGDIVLAVGNPLGLASSVTNGIVSALGRTVSEPQGQGSPGATIPDAIQTSAAINPGNSGGALVDLAGEVVGIPTLAAVSPEGGGAAPGIGFAISSDTVRRIAPQLAATGKVTEFGAGGARREGDAGDRPAGQAGRGGRRRCHERRAGGQGRRQARRRPRVGGRPAGPRPGGAGCGAGRAEGRRGRTRADHAGRHHHHGAGDPRRAGLRLTSGAAGRGLSPHEHEPRDRDDVQDQHRDAVEAHAQVLPPRPEDRVRPCRRR